MLLRYLWPSKEDGLLRVKTTPTPETSFMPRPTGVSWVGLVTAKATKGSCALVEEEFLDDEVLGFFGLGGALSMAIHRSKRFPGLIVVAVVFVVLLLVFCT